MAKTGRKPATSSRKPVTAAAKKTASAKAKTPASKTTARKAQKGPAKKAAPKKAAPRPAAKKPAARAVVAKKTAVKKTAAKKPVAAKATPKKAAPKKAAKKVTPKKVAVRKPAPKTVVVTKPAPKTVTVKKVAAKKASPKRRLPAPKLQPEREIEMVPMPPSSLALNSHSSAARSGRAEMAHVLAEHRTMSPDITAGDVDTNYEDAYFSGEGAPGGENPTPDQEVVDEIGRALGVEYADNEELRASDKVRDRDKHRWELDPASAEDYKEHGR